MVNIELGEFWVWSLVGSRQAPRKTASGHGALTDCLVLGIWCLRPAAWMNSSDEPAQKNVGIGQTKVFATELLDD